MPAHRCPARSRACRLDAGLQRGRGLRGALAAVALAVTCWPAGAAADIYRWTDKNGVVHFTNAPRHRRFKLAYRTGAGSVTSRRPIDVTRIPARDRHPGRYRRFDPFIHEAARIYSLPEALIRAVIKVESDYDPRVVSSAGAEGLMQLMPATAQSMRVEDSFNPRWNILGGSRYLRVLANRFGGDLVLTIAGYHAGERAVQRYGSIPPYDSTRRYVRMVLREYYKLRRVLALAPTAAAGSREAGARQPSP